MMLLSMRCVKKGESENSAKGQGFPRDLIEMRFIDSSTEIENVITFRKLFFA